MVEDRLARIEDHLTQLIEMVAQNNKSIDELRQQVGRLEQRMGKLEERMDIESALNTKRHLEILQQFRHMNADISHLDEMVHKHEQLLQK